MVNGVVFLLFVLTVTGVVAVEYKVRVAGNLTCQGKPADDYTTVMLKERDVFFDDLLDMKTTKNGAFYLAGKENVLFKSSFNPYLVIRHHCGILGDLFYFLALPMGQLEFDGYPLNIVNEELLNRGNVI